MEPDNTYLVHWLHGYWRVSKLIDDTFEVVMSFIEQRDAYDYAGGLAISAETNRLITKNKGGDIIEDKINPPSPYADWLA